MGGRGSSSISVGNSGQVIEVGSGTVSAGSLGIGGEMSPDSRKDIQTMFVSHTGFSEVLGTDDMDTAVLGAYGIQLNNLERRFGAIGGSDNVSVGMTKGADFVAAVSYNPLNPAQQTLILNHSDMGKISKAVSQQRASEKSGWSMPTDGSVKSMARYTVTHEYGHLLHNQLYANAAASGYTGTRNQFIGSAMREIKSNAIKHYGATQKDLSTYGASNSREFFAETFANANLGNPNALGRGIGPKSGSIKDRQVSFSIEKIDFNTPVEERIYDGKDGGEVFLPTFFGPINCKKVFLEGVRFEQGFFWNIAPVYCEELIIRGVEVESVGIPRGDGIDITCCKYVLIEYSTMSCGDDNFAMKGGRNEYGEAIGRASENIVMRRCLTLRGHGGITCGSETAGWIRNLYTHDCVFDGTQVGIRFKTRRPRAGGGENLTYERIRMNTTKGAIVWDMLGNPAWIGELAARKPAQRWTKLTPAFRAITIRDVVVEGCRELIDMKAIPESPVRYLQIENLTLDMSRTKSDPSNRRLMLLRDVEGMSMRNFRMIGAKKPLIEVVDGRNLIFENWQTEGITPEVQYEGDLTGDIRFYNCPGWEAFSR